MTIQDGAPEDPKDPVAEGAQATEARGMEMTAGIEGQDVESAELAAAQAALETELKAPTVEPATPAAEPVKAVEAASEEKGGDGKSPAPTMIPKARFDEAQAKLREENAFLRGKLQALSEVGRPASPQEAPAPTPHQQAVQTIKDSMVDVERRYEAGEISSADRVQIITDLTEEMVKVKAEELVENRLRDRGRDESPLDAAFAERHALKLEEDHPYLLVITDEQLNTLNRHARAIAQADGKPIKGGRADDLRLRTAIAELSDLYGPKWHPNAELPKKTAPTTPTAAAPTPPLSPKAKATAAKVALANGMPPDTRNLGTSVTDPSPINEAAIMQMSDLDLESLSARDRARILQGA